MIKLEELTPEVYYQQSRDFQYLGRLFDLVLNSTKTNSDVIYDIPKSDAAGSKLIDLLALTLGFKTVHEYNIKQLANVCSIFQTILRNKGTKYAIDLACTAILNAEGITDEHYVNIKEGTNVQIFMPWSVSDLNLLKDLLDYILPAGVTCEIARTTMRADNIAKTISKINNSIVKYEQEDNSSLSQLLNNTEANATITKITTTGSDDFIDDKNAEGVSTNSSLEKHTPSN